MNRVDGYFRGAYQAAPCAQGYSRRCRAAHGPFNMKMSGRAPKKISLFTKSWRDGKADEGLRAASRRAVLIG